MWQLILEISPSETTLCVSQRGKNKAVSLSLQPWAQRPAAAVHSYPLLPKISESSKEGKINRAYYSTCHSLISIIDNLGVMKNWEEHGLQNSGMASSAIKVGISV